MKFLRKYWTYIVEAAFFAFIFFYGRLPLRDFDIWFHIKAGELFVQLGRLPYKEFFSHTAAGREWIHFEWLFQIFVYLLSLGGLKIIPVVMAVFVTITYFFFLRILRFIFGLPLILSLILTLVFFSSTYEFNTARPHAIAYMFLTIHLFLILARYFKGKKWVYLTPFMTLIWTNIHSTGFLSWGFLLAFGLIAFFQWLFKRQKELFITSKELLILAVVNFLVTITPPMGFLDYKLLWKFFSERHFLGVFVAEWVPTYVTDNPLGIIIYTIITIITFLSLFFVTIKKKAFIDNLWVLPLLLMGLIGYTAARNVYLGLLGMILLLGFTTKYFLEYFDHLRIAKIRLLIWLAIGTFLIAFFGLFLLPAKKYTFNSERHYYPAQAAEFAKRYLSGNMFNEYTYGGFLVYWVYPKLKVFIDGRAEVYLCCEMKDYVTLASNKYLPDEKYRKFLNSFWGKYHINFAIIGITKHSVVRKIAKLLSNDPSWALVFWDDEAQIFVRRDGKNDEVIHQFEAKVVTPYLRDPFPKDKIKQALFEYERMDGIAQSAHTSNALGLILLQQAEFEKAQKRFLEGVKLDPTFESSYMNLGELAAKDGNLEGAVSAYSKALKLADDRGLIYIRLGQLILEATGDKDKVRKLWQKGIEKTIDEDAKAKLKELLSTL